MNRKLQAPVDVIALAERLNAIPEVRRFDDEIEREADRIAHSLAQDYGAVRAVIVERRLTDRERAIVEKLLSSKPELWNKYSKQLDSLGVTEMSDGGMGSILFSSKRDGQRSLQKSIAEGEFLDKDDVVVSITLNVDQFGELFELDAWKVDFSPLIAWPKSERVTVK